MNLVVWSETAALFLSEKENGGELSLKKKKRGWGIKSKCCILYSVMCGVFFFLVNVFSECLTIPFEIILWLYNIMAAFCSNVALWGKDSLVSRELCTTSSVLRKHS